MGRVGRVRKELSWEEGHQLNCCVAVLIKKKKSCNKLSSHISSRR